MLMLNRGFFSLQDRTGSRRRSRSGNLGLNAMLDVAFYRFGTWGIPLATAVSNIVATGVLLVLMRRRLGRIGGAAITFSLLKITVASAIVAVVSFAVWWPLDDLLGRSFPAQVVSLGAALLLATTAYWRPVARFGYARCRRYSPCAAVSPAADQPWTKRTSATSRSSRTSTTASRRSPIASSS